MLNFIVLLEWIEVDVRLRGLTPLLLRDFVNDTAQKGKATNQPTNCHHVLLANALYKLMTMRALQLYAFGQ